MLASIDTRTNRVIEPAAEGGGTKKAAAEDAGTSWLPLAAPSAALLILLAAAGRFVLIKRRAEPITEVWEANSDRHAPTA